MEIIFLPFIFLPSRFLLDSTIDLAAGGDELKP
jgi:hypothetical protein